MNRLADHFGDQFRRLAQFLKADLFADRPVFREVASRLPHDPDRDRATVVAVAGVDEMCCRSSPCVRFFLYRLRENGRGLGELVIGMRGGEEADLVT